MLVGMAAELLLEKRIGFAAQRRDIGDGDTDALRLQQIPDEDADRALGRDPGIDDGKAPGALAG